MCGICETSVHWAFSVVWKKYTLYCEIYFECFSIPVPTSPVDLHAAAEQMGELHVTWKKPKQPNGNVTHYVVYWQLQEINSKPFDQRNYCTDRKLKSPIHM